MKLVSVGLPDSEMPDHGCVGLMAVNVTALAFDPRARRRAPPVNCTPRLAANARWPPGRTVRSAPAPLKEIGPAPSTRHGSALRTVSGALLLPLAITSVS